MNSLELPPHWFARDPGLVARELLGKRLIRVFEGQRLSGEIVETEAYLSERDSASHAARGETPGNRSMFQQAGTAYVYPIHAKHCFNVVTESVGVGSAVLIRAIQPIEGLAEMQQRRGGKELGQIANGPAKLCQALSIDRAIDGTLLLPLNEVWIEGIQSRPLPQTAVKRTVRIGVTSAETLKLRFVIRDHAFASGPKAMR